MPLDTVLPGLDLPAAPAITRPAARPVRRPKAPAVALVVLGALLVVGPVVGGLFSKAASGRQLLDAFRPHLQDDALARYASDLRTVRAAGGAVDAVYATGEVAPGRFPGIDAYRGQSQQIGARADALLDRVRSAQDDFRAVDRVGGFDRVPFLVVTAGLVAVWGGGVLLAGSTGRARTATGLVVLASAALVTCPFLSDLPEGSRAGQRMVASLAPAMTPQQVSALQRDFVVLVTAEGQLDTGFRAVPAPAPAAAALTKLRADWPGISSDLATLVGTINDGIGDYRALHDLDRLGHPLGTSGLAALPWALVGAGAVVAGLATAARPRREEHP